MSIPPAPATTETNLPPRLYLPAAVGGVLLFASFFPLSFGFLIWVALIPWMLLAQSTARPRRIYGATFVGALVFYLPAIQWMRVAHPAMYGTWIGLSLYCSMFALFTMAFTRSLLRRRLPLTIAAPVAWVAVEYLRAHAPTGFAWLPPQYHLYSGFGWYFVGYSQHDFLTLIQIADLTGVYGVSLLIVLANACLWLWWKRLRDPLAARPIVGTTVWAWLFGAAIGYGVVSLDHPPFEEGPRVAMLQGNVPQDVKMSDGGLLTEHYVELWNQALFATGQAPDLTIFPETSIADSWVDKGPGFADPKLPRFTGTKGKLPKWETARQKHLDERNTTTLVFSYVGGVPAGIASLQQCFQIWHKPVLFGLNAFEVRSPTEEVRYNSALLWADNKQGARYDKMHLVPFGEYVPMRRVFPFLSALTPYKGDYSCEPGKSWTRFPLLVNRRTYYFGCLICYEDTDPSFAREYALSSVDGPPVDFLVNISNDGWFDGTPEHEEHLAICRFRAIESRRSVVRAVNMGISGIIDSDGRVVAIPGESWRKSKKMSAVVVGNVPLDKRTSVYSKWGDWLPIGCLAIYVLTLFLISREKRRR